MTSIMISKESIYLVINTVVITAIMAILICITIGFTNRKNGTLISREANRIFKY